jgi:hypothetical protein
MPILDVFFYQISITLGCLLVVVFFFFFFFNFILKLQRQQTFPFTNNTCLKSREKSAQVCGFPILLKMRERQLCSFFSPSSWRGIRTTPR